MLATFNFLALLVGSAGAAKLSNQVIAKTKEELDYITKDNSKCEVCRVVTNKLGDQFIETGRHYQVIEKGYNFELRDAAPQLDYGKSQLRLIESTERTCLQLFHAHMEYEKKLNDTKRAYRYEEIQLFKGKCDQFVERWEDEIEVWYLEHEGSGMSLQDYLCRGVVLKQRNSQTCLGPRKKVKTVGRKRPDVVEYDPSPGQSLEEDELIN